MKNEELNIKKNSRKKTLPYRVFIRQVKKEGNWHFDFFPVISVFSIYPPR
jgi:hypothetical protein